MHFQLPCRSKENLKTCRRPNACCHPWALSSMTWENESLPTLSSFRKAIHCEQLFWGASILSSHRVLTCLSSLPVFATWVPQLCAYYLVLLNPLYVWGSLYFVKLHFLTCLHTPRSECLMARRWLCVTIVLIEWNNP